MINEDFFKHMMKGQLSWVLVPISLYIIFYKKELIKYLNKNPILHSVQITPQLKYRKYNDLLELYNKTTQYIEKWKEERQAEIKLK